MNCLLVIKNLFAPQKYKFSAIISNKTTSFFELL
jgi:hypothetical protein